MLDLGVACRRPVSENILPDCFYTLLSPASPPALHVNHRCSATTNPPPFAPLCAIAVSCYTHWWRHAPHSWEGGTTRTQKPQFVFKRSGVGQGGKVLNPDFFLRRKCLFLINCLNGRRPSMLFWVYIWLYVNARVRTCVCVTEKDREIECEWKSFEKEEKNWFELALAHTDIPKCIKCFTL